MARVSRRSFLDRSLALTASGYLGSGLLHAAKVDRSAAANLHLAAFRFDVTPPLGSSCCGGWIKPVEAVDDPLQALGLVLLGSGAPIVLCAVDWTGILNSAHVAWRRALAEAAGTTPERVAVQCVHQHNAPFACLDAEEIVARQGDLPHIIELDFFNRCLERGREAIAESLRQARPVTHIAHGEAPVLKVASNRRVLRDDNRKVVRMRSSSCVDPELIALPEGTIDPLLKTIAFYDHQEKIAACHYYATHPMSYYGDGRVTSDFAGLARKQRQRDEPDCLHVYFTGCAGNIAAGKYNDGTPATRNVLTGRMYDGIVQSEQKLQPQPISELTWRTVDILPEPRALFVADELEQAIADKERRTVERNRPAFTLAWLRRLEQRQPIVLSALSIDNISMLHLPAECFVQYQLRGQRLAPDRFVATAAYGDGGPWYIPIQQEYPCGGYEVGVAFCEPTVDDLLARGMQKLLM